MENDGKIKDIGLTNKVQDNVQDLAASGLKLDENLMKQFLLFQKFLTSTATEAERQPPTQNQSFALNNESVKESNNNLISANEVHEVVTETNEKCDLSVLKENSIILKAEMENEINTKAILTVENASLEVENNKSSNEHKEEQNAIVQPKKDDQIRNFKSLIKKDHASTGKLQTNAPPESKPEHNPEKIEKTNKNLFDELPIKGSNSDFISLLEKEMTNHKYDEDQEFSKKTIPKKTIKKKEKKEKKEKESTTDKKYNYYTDNFKFDQQSNAIPFDSTNSYPTIGFMSKKSASKIAVISNSSGDLIEPVSSIEFSDPPKNKFEVVINHFNEFKASGESQSENKKQTEKVENCDYGDESTTKYNNLEEADSYNALDYNSDSKFIYPTVQTKSDNKLFAKNEAIAIQNVLVDTTYASINNNQIENSKIQSISQHNNDISSEVIRGISETKINSTQIDATSGAQQPKDKKTEELRDSLKKEIEIFHNKNAQLNLLIIQNKELTKKLDREKLEFARHMRKEQEDFEKFKDQEMKTIKKLKCSASGGVQTVKVTSKRDNEEVQTLKSSLLKIQEDSKKKETNFKMIIESLKSQLVESNRMHQHNSAATNINVQQPDNCKFSPEQGEEPIIRNNFNYNCFTQKHKNSMKGNGPVLINQKSKEKLVLYNSKEDLNATAQKNDELKKINNKKYANISSKINTNINSNKSNLRSASKNPDRNIAYARGIEEDSDNPIYIGDNTKEISMRENRELKNTNKPATRAVSKPRYVAKVLNNKQTINDSEAVLFNINNVSNQKGSQNEEAIKEDNDFTKEETKFCDPIKKSSDANNKYGKGNTNKYLEDYSKYDLHFPVQYKFEKMLLKQEKLKDNKIVNFYKNDIREVLFPSGVKKEIHPDGYQLVCFPNNDIKQLFPDGKMIYFFHDSKTVQSTIPAEKIQVFKFSNGQIEKHFEDGTKEIMFPDGVVKKITNIGAEQTISQD